LRLPQAERGRGGIGVLFFSESDVRRLLPMPQAIRLMRQAFESLARGEALNQPRRRLILPGGSVLHYMAAGDGKYFGAKIYSTHPRHPGHFLFLLYRAGDAAPLALFEANHLGRIRTGAASGLATDLMARPGADVVGLIGSGFQARTQAEAMAAVRPVREIRIWSRSEEKRRAFAAELSASLPVRVMAARSAEEAIRGAGIVVTATSSRDPVVEAGWVEPGAHVNAVGSNQPNRRELPASLVRAAGLIAVDSLEQARMESGDLLLGLEDWSRVVELKDLVGGVHTKAEDITIFKSNGLAIEDVIAAGYVYERGLSEGAGQSLPVFQDYS